MRFINFSTFFVGSLSVCVAVATLRFLFLVLCHKPAVLSSPPPPPAHHYTHIISCQFFYFFLYFILLWCGGKFNFLASKFGLKLLFGISRKAYQLGSRIHLSSDKRYIEWNIFP
jgi:hypothetical protein